MKIGLVGYSRTGKDTVGQMIGKYLLENEHGKTKRLAFGDDLKERFFQAFPEAHNGKKPREGYEIFGELGRSIDADMWIRPVEYSVNLYSGIYENFVITDIRQMNEAKWATENGFTLIKVWSPEELRKERSKGDTNWIAVNPSERKLDRIKCDHIVWNMWDLENTKEQVEFILENGGILNNGK
jgi:dephospho-CoA kinase